MNEQLRLAHVVLAAAGALGAHVAGYLIAGLASTAAIDGSGGHAYLSGIGPWVGFAGVLALTWLAVAGGRNVGVGSVVRFRSLLGLQVGLFAAQESLERLAAGHSLTELLTEPAVLIGLLLQPLLALGLIFLVRWGAQLVARIVASTPSFGRPLPSSCAAPLFGPRPLLLPAVSRRGPPRSPR